MSAKWRISLGTIVATIAVLAAVSPAFAHSEFRPDEAESGQVAAVELYVENEQSDAGTVKVQLHFPEDQPITLAALPSAPGWTTSVEGGAVGGPVTDVIWTRATAEPEDVLVPLSLGPLPADTTRLQFKVIQTYSNGEIDRWIEDWPEGSPEPEAPGPVFSVTGGTAAVTTVPSVTAGSSTTTTTAAPAAADDEDDDDSNAPLIIGAVIVALALAATGAYFLGKRRNRG